MVDKEYNNQAGVYKVQTFGTTQIHQTVEKFKYKDANKALHQMGNSTALYCLW